MPTAPERLASLEEWREGFEDKMERQFSAIDTRMMDADMREQKRETLLIAINDTVVSMRVDMQTRDATEKAVNGDRRRRKMDSKDWAVLLVAAATASGAIIGALTSK